MMAIVSDDKASDDRMRRLGVLHQLLTCCIKIDTAFYLHISFPRLIKKAQVTKYWNAYVLHRYRVITVNHGLVKRNG